MNAERPLPPSWVTFGVSRTNVLQLRAIAGEILDELLIDDLRDFRAFDVEKRSSAGDLDGRGGGLNSESEIDGQGLADKKVQPGRLNFAETRHWWQ